MTIIMTHRIIPNRLRDPDVKVVKKAETAEKKAKPTVRQNVSAQKTLRGVRR